MKKIVLVYGSISGLIVAFMLIITFGFMMKGGKEMNFEGGEVVGYSTMVLSMSMIFIGVGVYRAKYLNGRISFFRAWGTGLLIAFIGSLFYVITWVIMYKGFMPDFMDNYSQQMIKKAQESGKTVEEITKVNKEMQSIKQIYSTWPGLIGITFIEIFPVGFIMSLVSAIIFTLIRRKPNTNHTTTV